MKNNLLLDTSLIIDFLRVEDKDSTILQQLANKQSSSTNNKYKLYISIVSHTELYAGKRIWESASALKELALILSGLEILNLDQSLSKNAGKIKSEYGLGIADAIIAATALASKLTLATLNTKDFKEIKGLKLYPLKSS